MDVLFQGGNWIIWFYIIVLLPFQIYDICKDKNKGYKNYLIIVIYASFALIAGIGTLVSRKYKMIDSSAFYVILIVAYLQSIIDGFTHKSKRNTFFCCVFTIFILLILIYDKL